ncbi:MAG: hypothetical protein ACOCV1_07305 [Bacillota bacterium]
MRKRNNIIIIIITTITFIILHLTGVTNPFILSLLVIPFYLMNLIFYSETRLFIAFNLVTIISLIGYFFFIQYNNIYPINLIFMAMTDIGKFIAFFLMFGLVLQNKINKHVERIIIYLNIFNYIFLSLTRHSTARIIANFIGFTRDVQETTFIVFEIVFIVLYLAASGLKIYTITILDRRKSFRIRKNKRRQEKIENSFY